MTRDESLEKFLAESVMGWEWCEGNAMTMFAGRWEEPNGGTHLPQFWNPLKSWSDAGQLWERVREKGLQLQLSGWPKEWFAAFVWRAAPSVRGDVSADSGPHAITEAIARATGWEEPTP
jgi:hypothetical protein